MALIHLCFEDFVEKLKETLKMPVIVEEKLFNFRSSLKKNNAKGMNMGSNSEPLFEILVSFIHTWGCCIFRPAFLLQKTLKNCSEASSENVYQQRNYLYIFELI